jgi:hypothetical protein
MGNGPARALAGIGLALCGLATGAAAQPIGTAFTYQGRLADAGSPANGPYDLQLALFDAAAGGAQVGPLVTRDDVVVADGLFTVSLDFGAAFAGNARWLELRVRPGASTGAYTTLSPRQELTASPYALFTTAAPWTGIAGKPAGFADDVDNDALGGLACANGQIARWNGSAWTCVGDNAHDHLGQTWNGPGLGLRVESSTADGVQGVSSALAASGVLGLTQASAGRGVMGVATSTAGTAAVGVLGQSDSTVGRGVLGLANATTGVNYGVRGQVVSSQGIGVYGLSIATEGSAHGVRGDSQSSTGRGVWGFANTTGGIAYGVFGESNSDSGRGVHGRATAEFGEGVGVEGQSASHLGIGVLGTSTATAGFSIGVRGITSTPGGQGVSGSAEALSDNSIGVWGSTQSSVGSGVSGFASSETGSAAGVTGGSAAAGGYGIYGYSLASDGNGIGVIGLTFGGTGPGVVGRSYSTTGASAVLAENFSDDRAAVMAQNYSGSGQNWGVWGIANSTAGRGVQGQSNASSGVGVYGINFTAGGLAGFFQGDVHVNGTLSKNAGAFRIDHPLDPEHKYLQHSFVESPDMMNVYNGNVTLDNDGEAEVRLPEWFEALNRDFRYQLTAVGQPGPGLHVAMKIKGNRFRIGGGSPGMEVSWQVTGIRHDAYAEAHRIPVEVDKAPADRGRYLQPAALGQPEEKAVELTRTPKAPAAPPARPPAPIRPPAVRERP